MGGSTVSQVLLRRRLPLSEQSPPSLFLGNNNPSHGLSSHIYKLCILLLSAVPNNLLFIHPSLSSLFRQRVSWRSHPLSTDRSEPGF